MISLTPEERRAERARQRIDLLSAVLMAAATIATAWSAYQSAQWGGNDSHHQSQASVAIIRVGKFSNLALQRTGVHVQLFTQWATAVGQQNARLADFLLSRFPEPLKAATVAWRATSPLTNADAPASPFDMPEYVLKDQAEAARWEQIATLESAAANRAGELASRYLLFTIIFACVLFFAGISGKFTWPVVDVVVLVLGALALVAGLVVVLKTPLAP